MGAGRMWAAAMAVARQAHCAVGMAAMVAGVARRRDQGVVRQRQWSRAAAVPSRPSSCRSGAAGGGGETAVPSRLIIIYRPPSEAAA